MEFKVVIPARYGSSRLPGKPLIEIAGKPMIQHVFERARESMASQVVVATDDERIAETVSAFGGAARTGLPKWCSGWGGPTIPSWSIFKAMSPQCPRNSSIRSLWTWQATRTLE